MHHRHRAAFALAFSLAASSPHALAEAAASDADLRALVRAQAEQIRELNRRLSELERKQAGGAPVPAQAQVAAAVADTREDELRCFGRRSRSKPQPAAATATDRA